jgi:hypothetical protein
MQQIIDCISQAADIARRKFTAGEQSMLLDIFNGTFLTPGILGQHIIAQVEDSFRLYPGEYESKWSVDKTAMLEKINALDQCDSALMELWAVGFWQINPEAVDDYLAGKLTLGSAYTAQLAALDFISDRLEKTKGSFKSGEIANCRTELDRVIEKLRG